MRELTELRSTIEVWRGLQHQIDENLSLLELVEGEGDAELVSEIESSTSELARRLEDLEFELTLSGPHDRRPAILAIHCQPVKTARNPTGTTAPISGTTKALAESPENPSRWK